VISLSTAANIKLSSLGWVIVVRNFDLTKVRASFPMDVTPPPLIYFSSDLMGAQNEPRGGSAPCGPPRGYATGTGGHVYGVIGMSIKSRVFLFEKMRHSRTFSRT